MSKNTLPDSKPRQLKEYLLRHRVGFGWLGVFVALTIATLYYFVTPNEAAVASGVGRFILLYAHSICWILLAFASALWSLKVNGRIVSAFAYMALAVYAAFMITLFVVKSAA